MVIGMTRNRDRHHPGIVIGFAGIRSQRQPQFRLRQHAPYGCGNRHFLRQLVALFALGIGICGRLEL